MIAQLHHSYKVLESSLEPMCASHLYQLFLLSLNFQCGVGLSDHRLVLILLELEDPPLAHDSEQIN